MQPVVPDFTSPEHIHDCWIEQAVTLVETVAYDGTVYDLVLESEHTFFANGMLVHNCEECHDVDGEVMDFGSDRQEELHPPYVKCLGEDRCRCQQIALLSNGQELEVDEIDEDAIDTD